MSSSDHIATTTVPSSRPPIVEALSRRLGPSSGEDGSSIVEFVMLATLLLIPIIYFVLGLSAVQGAAYAATGAADQAAKMYVSAQPGDPEADTRSEAAVLAALQDFSIDPDRAEVARSCPRGGCTADGDLVAFTVEIQVPVPLVPGLGDWRPTLVSVSSTSAQVQGG